MPTIIPNKIHFIWVGNEVPNPQARNLAKWAMENPQYEGVWLWTNTSNIERNADIIANILREYPNVERVTALTDIIGVKKLIVFRNDTRNLIAINIRSISTLHALGNPSHLYEELTHWKNYGAVSDIIRIWALHAKGGIYLDFDTYSTGAPLPTNINAPFNIHFKKNLDITL
ncbi:TcdA/TcdB catalytic glycosyltransferase domain-containing protein [Maridesulfovibrio zosterae]|uniref:TcdA/TcdB catalytic glycosyltransferase domain-containing protein n=1 Tax=Maridesulfovibrio zosterae TaxID=82171 RepID=UPI000484116A|nr:TcdA/TcdB catalytic glycosyltransferase domain-containing protein [Maridesulfovibrio zosterae]